MVPMKTISALIALAVGLGAAPVNAFDSVAQTVPTIRLTIPFGPATQSGEKKLSLGFQSFGSSQQSIQDGLSFYAPQMPDLISLGWSNQGLRSLGFGGINALVTETRLNADGSESTTFGIRTDYLVMGLVGAAVVGGFAYAATKDDDDNSTCYNGLGAAVAC